MSVSKRTYWIIWLAVTVLLAVYLFLQITGEDKTIYLPGATTHGHYQIEMACSACHADSFGGGKVLQEACMQCHGEELEASDDSHPKSKFTNPRNADRVAKLDARKCITCHTEHKEEITLSMGVTVPDDVCFKCHQDVAEDRPSHTGMGFETCASAGCHNFHDNKALYEDFMAKHLDEADVNEFVTLKTLSTLKEAQALDTYPKEKFPLKPLSASETDQPASIYRDPKIIQDWADTAHSQSGVNCTACHEQKTTEQDKPTWVDKPTHVVCEKCHTNQTKGFLAGKHGMRLAQELSPMTPGHARSQMEKTAHGKELSCVSCHSAHKFETKHAAVEACLSCHDDEHSVAYKQSKHFGLWHKETTGQTDPGTGVSCATCHLPRKEINHEGEKNISVGHNQNDNLRPNEKMLRSVCMQCHGLGFSIDALADPDLIKKNFSEKPGVHIESLDMVKKRLGLKKDVEGM